MSEVPALAQRVKERREELGRSRHDVVLDAKQKGYDISVNTVVAVEQGQRQTMQPRKAEALAAGLNWTVDDLMGRTPAAVNGSAADMTSIEELVRRSVAAEIKKAQQPGAVDQLTTAIQSLTDDQLATFENLVGVLLDRIGDERSARADEA